MTASCAESSPGYSVPVAGTITPKSRSTPTWPPVLSPHERSRQREHDHHCFGHNPPPPDLPVPSGARATRGRPHRGHACAAGLRRVPRRCEDPWRPWVTWRVLCARGATPVSEDHSVTIVVMTRDRGDQLCRTLPTTGAPSSWSTTARRTAPPSASG